MKKKLLLMLTMIWVFLLGAAETQAQAKGSNENSALLYEITGKNLEKPSYLFGTIHLICQKDMFPAEKLNGYLSQTDQLMLEFDMDDQALIQQMLKFSMMADGKSIKDLMTAEDYAKLDTVYKDYLGISFDLLQKFKPMIAQTYLLTSPKILGCQPPMVYDNYLMQNASAAKKPVIGLETAEEQIAVIDSQPIDKQIQTLKDLAADPEKSAAEFKAMYQKYLAQNSDELYEFIQGQMKKDDGLSQEKMLDDRNTKWIPIIEQNIATKPSFIAVGSGHLGGPKGVVSLLRAQGYTLKPIKL